MEEFVARKHELLRLNKARRVQIEQFLCAKAGMEISLETAIQSRIGSNEHEALRLFAYQVSVFHLLQILLLKRWEDTGLLGQKTPGSENQTLNWQITSFLKRNVKRMLGRHDWSFLKQNIYSWFSPAKEVRERLRLMLEPVNLAASAGDFPAHFLQELGLRSRLSLLGFNPSSIDSTALWRLLLEQKAHDQRLGSPDQLDYASTTSGALLVSGLRNGECLNSLRALTATKELHDVWAFTDSEFERYLSEIFILWDSASEVPRINIHPRAVLHESHRSTKSASLFQEGVTVPYHAQLAACFHTANGRELEDCSAMLDQLRENGLLLISSDQFWPTDGQELSEKLRDTALRKSCVRLIVDLRQLTAPAGESLPRGLCILEKCASKEVRDSNRPQIIRARGKLVPELAGQFWDAILGCVRQDASPGEVVVRTVGGQGGESLRIEAMSAAAHQQQLRTSAWNTLSDPNFYEASGRLRRSPNKAFALGTILRWKPETKLPTPRAILLQEDATCLRAALPSQENYLSAELPRHLFLPDNSMVEHANFLLAQLYSAPIQFWYRLETEQNAGKKLKGVERQSEQRLKLMPLVRLFEPGTLLPVSNNAPLFGSLDEARASLHSIFRQPNLGPIERSRLHEIVISLEKSITANIESCAELSRHLFPELGIHRWHLPSALPQPAAQFVFEIFSHLDKSPLAHHPAVHITRLRNVHDFKVTNVACDELPMGGLAELRVYHGADAVLRLNGPSLILQVTHAEIQQRIGRPWREIADTLKFPTDFSLVRTQLQEVIKSIDSQLQFTREHVALLDQIFCCLFGLSPNFMDENTRQTMRRHLSPDEGKISVQFQREKLITASDFEVPKGFLQ